MIDRFLDETNVLLTLERVSDMSLDIIYQRQKKLWCHSEPKPFEFSQDLRLRGGEESL